MKQFCGVRIVTFFRTCRLDVFRVVIEVYGLLKGRKAASIVGAAKLILTADPITRRARHVMVLLIAEEFESK